MTLGDKLLKEEGFKKTRKGNTIYYEYFSQSPFATDFNEWQVRYIFDLSRKTIDVEVHYDFDGVTITSSMLKALDTKSRELGWY